MFGNQSARASEEVPDDLYEVLRSVHRSGNTRQWKKLMGTHANWISHNYETWMAYPPEIVDSEVEMKVSMSEFLTLTLKSTMR